MLRIDRRADHYAASKPRDLDRITDLTALSQEGRLHLVRAHSAHVRNDWKSYLTAVDALDSRLVSIGDIARLWAGEVEMADVISANQLGIWESAAAAA